MSSTPATTLRATQGAADARPTLFWPLALPVLRVALVALIVNVLTSLPALIVPIAGYPTRRTARPERTP